MRKPFIEKLTELAENDPRIILIVGDVGFSFLEGFKERFPNQFLNIGICEQSMMNVAVGMANMGWKPYVYTMSNFIILRPYEQVRNNICYGNSNVKLFGVKGSDAYRFLGMSHNLYKRVTTFKDWKIETEEEQLLLQGLPNLNFYVPTTETEVTDLMTKEYSRIGPSYMRI
jgi:transketolase